jgi:hypothetical protein
MTKRRFLALAGAILIGLPLAACAPVPDGGPTPTAPAETIAPTETPIAEPGAAAVIVLSGDSLQIQDAEGTTIDTHSFTDDPALVAESLTSAIGTEPVVNEHDTAGECTAAGTAEYTWTVGGSNLTVTTASPDAVAPWDTLDVRTAARSIGDITIVTSAGFSIGDDASAFVQTLPADEHQDGAAFIWDRAATYDSQPFGGTAFADETGVVNFLGTPGLMQSWYC